MSKKNRKQARRQQEPQPRQQEPLLQATVWILVFLVSIVPLIVFMKFQLTDKALAFFRPGGYDTDVFSWYKAWALIVGTSLFVAAAILHGISRKRKIFCFSSKRIIILLGAYVLFSLCILLACLLSDFPKVSLYGFFSRYEGTLVWGAYMALFIGVFATAQSGGVARLVRKGFLWSSVYIMGFALFQTLGFEPYKTDFVKRILLPAQFEKYMNTIQFSMDKTYATAFFSNPNYYGSYIALLFPVVLAMVLFAGNRKTRGAGMILLIAAIVTLYGSRSDAGLISIIFSSIAVLLLSLFKRHQIRMFSKLAATAVLLCSLSAVFAVAVSPSWAGDGLQPWSNPPATGDSIDRFAEYIIDDYGTLGSNRIYIWARALQMAKQTVILGHGADTFALYFPQNDPINTKLYGVHTLVDKPHNMYIQVLIGFGGIALLAFLVFLAVLFFSSLRAIIGRYEPESDGGLMLGLFGAFFGFLVVSMFNDSVVGISQIFWIFSGMLAAFAFKGVQVS